MKTCKVCERDQFKIIYTSKNNKILRCRYCGFGLLEKSPSKKKTKNIYQKEYFDDKKEKFFEKEAERKYFFVRKWIPKGGKVLDYGCGLGDFVNICKKHGIDVYGYDLSSYAVAYVKNKYKANASDNLKDRIFKKNSFTAVVSFDVIEHIPEFEKMIKTVFRLLKKDGLFLLTTPNIESWDAKLFGKKWYGFKKIPEHINYFCPTSLDLLLKRNNFKLEKVIPNWGFVRSIKFVKSNTKLKFIPKIFDNIYLCFPMTDMLVVARKK